MMKAILLCLILALLTRCGRKAEAPTNQFHDTSSSGNSGNYTFSSPTPTPTAMVSNVTHRVFISSLEYPSNLGGLSGADQKCQTLAQGAGLTGSWKAILSTRVMDARDRLKIKGAIVDMKGNQLALNAAELWGGNIKAPIRYNEKGLFAATRIVWTGTNSDGRKNTFTYTTQCGDWTGENGGVQAGRTDQSDFRWVGIYDPALYQPSHACSNHSSLYCMENVD